MPMGAGKTHLNRVAGAEYVHLKFWEMMSRIT
jgi:hypothetical protein